MELYSRRFISAILCWLREGMDEDQLRELQLTLDKASRVPHPLMRQTKPQFVQTTRPKPDGGFRKYSRWQAPPGWTPPGWKSDAEAYAHAKSAMSFVQSKEVSK